MQVHNCLVLFTIPANFHFYLIVTGKQYDTVFKSSHDLLPITIPNIEGLVGPWLHIQSLTRNKTENTQVATARLIHLLVSTINCD